MNTNTATKTSAPDTYLVCDGGIVYTLSPDESEVWTCTQDAGGVIDWENLGEIFPAEGSAPHIATLTALLKAARAANTALGECF